MRTKGKFYVEADPVDPTTYRLNRNSGRKPSHIEKGENALFMSMAPEMSEVLHKIYEWYEQGGHMIDFPEEALFSVLVRIEI